MKNISGRPLTLLAMMAAMVPTGTRAIDPMPGRRVRRGPRLTFCSGVPRDPRLQQSEEQAARARMLAQTKREKRAAKRLRDQGSDGR